MFCVVKDSAAIGGYHRKVSNHQRESYVVFVLASDSSWLGGEDSDTVIITYIHLSRDHQPRDNRAINFSHDQRLDGSLDWAV